MTGGKYRVWLPVDAHVGHFAIVVVVNLNDDIVEVPTMTSMAVFFNPWNPSDQTYIEGTLHSTSVLGLG